MDTKTKKEISQDLVRELFDYRDGELYWAVSQGAARIGNLAGGVMNGGYRQVGIDDKRYYAHRLVFLYHHGYLPEFLDHIDGNRSNNEISNLREATTQENSMNQKKQKSYNGKPTASKYKGVSWYKPYKKWLVQITIDYKMKHLGYFTSEIEAARAYNKAATKYFGEFALLNIIDASKHL